MSWRHVWKACGLVALILCVQVSASGAFAQGAGESYLLRWAPQPQSRAVYMLSSRTTRGESIGVRSERLTLRARAVEDGRTEFTVTGEPSPPNAPLAYRFQRALFGVMTFTVDELGNAEIPAGQPLPPFVNVPVFPERAVREGESWSGGPVAVFQDVNVGEVPFTYTSTLKAVEIYRGQRCAVIESEYQVALPEGASSGMPFLGIVQGDETGERGQGAPVGGVIENSPAHAAGLQAGDIITKAQGERIRGWGGLEELVPVLVPGRTVEFHVRRGEVEIKVEITPERVPLATVSASGGLHSTCYFSLEKGIPLKIDLVSQDLRFVLTDAEGNSDERVADIHYVMEYEYGGV